MGRAPADVAMIDVFEKIRAFLLEREPSLEAGALAPPADEQAWRRLPPSEYREILLAVLLGFDRATPAGRRAVRHAIATVRDLVARAEGRAVSERNRSTRTELFRRGARETWLRENLEAVAHALKLFTAPSGHGPVAIVEQVSRCATRRNAVTLLRKQIQLFRGKRVFEFLSLIGYPIVVPDPPRQRLFLRLGWIQKTDERKAYPQGFFEACERLIHLTGESWSVVNAATGLFAGSRDPATGAMKSLAVCGVRPRCDRCVVRGQCSYFRYRGEPEPTKSRSVKNMAFADQPRTRFEHLGPSKLSEAELLALIIRTGSEGRSSLDLAHEIIERFGSLEAIARAGLGELCRIKGVGRAKAIEIHAALELGRRLLGGSVPVGEPIRRSVDVFELYRGLLANEEQENFYLLVLNTRNRIQKHFLVSRGSLTSSLVHPREVIKVAVREAAAAVLFLHNHPSGDPDPSQDDRDITHRLVEAARLLGIRVLDHVIIGHDNYFSFADHGLL